jgi:hypothetical protein
MCSRLLLCSLAAPEQKSLTAAAEAATRLLFREPGSETPRAVGSSRAL